MYETIILQIEVFSYMIYNCDNAFISVCIKAMQPAECTFQKVSLSLINEVENGDVGTMEFEIEIAIVR